MRVQPQQCFDVLAHCANSDLCRTMNRALAEAFLTSQHHHYSLVQPTPCKADLYQGRTDGAGEWAEEEGEFAEEGEFEEGEPVEEVRLLPLLHVLYESLAE